MRGRRVHGFVWCELAAAQGCALGLQPEEPSPVLVTHPAQPLVTQAESFEGLELMDVRIGLSLIHI